jgi:hypothetical protein
METVLFSESVKITTKIQKDICLNVVTFSHGVYQSSISEPQDDVKETQRSVIRNYIFSPNMKLQTI